VVKIAHTEVKLAAVFHRLCKREMGEIMNWNGHKILQLAPGLALILAPGLLLSHPEARAITEMPWHKEHITHVLSVGYTQLGSAPNQTHADMKMVDHQACIVATMLGFDVDDSYAFNIDEDVELSVTYAPGLTTAPFDIQWDQNGGEGHGALRVTPEPGDVKRTVKLKLDRARFAGMGTRGIDIAIGPGRNGRVALCDIAISRSWTTKVPETCGQLKLTVKDDETGALMPVRAGIYDSTGRAPLPSESATLVERFGDKIRLLPIATRAFWPSPNRMGFYINGEYTAKLPVGTYEVAITRGPEYRVYHGTFEIKKDSDATVSVTMKRYADLPGRGWISGDDHIHLQREEIADQNVWMQVAAEDVHVGNLVQMGNITGTFFEQPAWGAAGHYTKDDKHTVVSGQEDPRTGQLGHTLHENLKVPIHSNVGNYFSYHEVFEESHRQGGVSGYAHIGEGFHAQRGLALDLPFGLVDFIEVCQGGRIGTTPWYDLMNLGFKVTPSAGSDFPYTDLPGVSRLYVKGSVSANPDAWYKSFKDGHVYVTNGPFLEFTVNGHQMGDEIHVAKGSKLEIAAEAQLNPDVDGLDRIELVSLGDVVATKQAAGQDKVQMKETITADHSMWLAVRAYGNRQDQRNTTMAHSAAIYVIVDEQPFWKRSAVPELVKRQRAMLDDIINGPLIPDEDLEEYQTGDVLQEEWPKQRELIKPRIAEADLKYRELLERFEISEQH
jgi:hypothetical protein